MTEMPYDHLDLTKLRYYMSFQGELLESLWPLFDVLKESLPD